MKRYAFLAMAAFALSAVPAAAQGISVFGGGGPAIPGSDFDNVDNGIILVGGVTVDVSERVSLYGEGTWGQHELSEVDVNPSSLMAGLLFGLTDDADAPLSPYIFGGAGVQTLSVDGDDESEFGFQLGAGVGFDLLGVGAFAEGRWHRASYENESVDDSVFSLFSILVGFSIDLTGDN